MSKQLLCSVYSFLLLYVLYCLLWLFVLQQGVSPNALPYIMAQQGAKLAEQLRNNQTLTDFRNNITALAQHGSDLLTIIMGQPNDDKLVQELVTNITSLVNMSVSSLYTVDRLFHVIN